MTTVGDDLATDPLAVVWLRAVLPGEQACQPRADVDINAVMPLSADQIEQMEASRFEASWFDTVAVGVELAGTRVVDVRALCSAYVTNEYEQCELWGRFDVDRSVVVDVELR